MKKYHVTLKQNGREFDTYVDVDEAWPLEISHIADAVDWNLGPGDTITIEEG